MKRLAFVSVLAGIGLMAPVLSDVPPEQIADYSPWVVQVDGKTAGEWQLEAELAQLQVDELQRKLHRRNGELAWQWRAFRRWRQARPWGHHPLEVAVLCLQSHEARWEFDGPIYDGGIQADRDFQRTYGADFLRWFGPAYRWPRSVQIAVAIRAIKSGRGFNPWPNTARACGLL